MSALEQPNQDILTITNAYKTYDGYTYVLKGVNMRVPEGCIYGLLGASGCGKSTLLNSVVGLMNLDYGEINTTVISRREIGFMPQEISLYNQMNSNEIFNYFGTMYGLNKDHLGMRVNFLQELLELPPKNEIVTKLSGGQLRRLSLSVALLHDPKILILDEPTAGVDILLRTTIWDHLLHLSQDCKKTIIITTHYIEEIIQAHMVGIMRDGIMLCEDSPTAIMQRHECSSMEDAFLKLSTEQSRRNPASEEYLPIMQKNSVPALFENTGDISTSRLTSETMKNFLFLRRNISITMFMIFVPFIAIIFFHLAIGQDPRNLKFGIINDELSAGLNFCSSFKPNSSCDTNFLSCSLMKNIEENNLQLVEFRTVQEATKAVHSSAILGTIHLRQNYSMAMYNRLNDYFKTNDNDLDLSEITIQMDSSNVISHAVTIKGLIAAYQEFMNDLAAGCGYSKKSVASPLSKPIYGHKSISYRESISPAIIMIVIFGMPTMFGMVIIIEDRNSGAIGRTLAAGTSITEVLFGYLVSNAFVVSLQTLISITAMYYILGYPFNQQFLSCILIFLVGLVAIALTFPIALSCTTLIAGSFCGVGVLLASFFTGGLLWPLQGAHYLLKPLIIVTPITLPAVALRGLTIKNWGLNNFQVVYGFVSVIVWITVLTTITFIIINRKKASAFVNK